MKEAVITALERFSREVVIDGWFWCQKVDEGKIGCCNYFATCRWSHQADNKSSISRKEEEEKNNRLKKRGKTWEKKQQQPVEEATGQIIEEEVSRNNDATQHTWAWSVQCSICNVFFKIIYSFEFARLETPPNIPGRGPGVK